MTVDVRRDIPTTVYNPATYSGCGTCNTIENEVLISTMEIRPDISLPVVSNGGICASVLFACSHSVGEYWHAVQGGDTGGFTPSADNRSDISLFNINAWGICTSIRVTYLNSNGEVNDTIQSSGGADDFVPSISDPASAVNDDGRLWFRAAVRASYPNPGCKAWAVNQRDYNDLLASGVQGPLAVADGHVCVCATIRASAAYSKQCGCSTIQGGSRYNRFTPSMEAFFVAVGDGECVLAAVLPPSIYPTACSEFRYIRWRSVAPRRSTCRGHLDARDGDFRGLDARDGGGLDA